MPIVAGRAFDARDIMGSPRVLIVNEAFARSLAPRNPVGLQVSVRPVDSPNDAPVTLEIIGVAKQVKQRPDESADYVQMYTPLLQDPIGDIHLLVKSNTGRADALTATVRAAISRIDRDQLVGVSSITTLEDVEWLATGRHRFRAVMVGAFAALAVVLAMVGVFGILAYSVQQRTRDFGVRRALGATSTDVLHLVVRDALRVIAIGAVIGLIASAMLGRMLGSMLFGVQPLDLPTFVLVTIVLGLTTTLAIAGPALRAARIDPAVALRSR